MSKLKEKFASSEVPIVVIVSFLLAIAGIAFLPLNVIVINGIPLYLWLSITCWLLCIGVPVIYYGGKALIREIKKELKNR